MIVFVRRSSVVLLLCILVLHFICISMLKIMARQTAAQEANCILLDAGHGAPDGGCVGADGTTEAALNLEVCRFLKTALEARGYRVRMTRTDENGIHAEGKSIAQKKRDDMKKRKAMRDQGAALFVSIHMNSFPQTQYRGAQVVYAPQNEAAEQLALCIQNTIREKADRENRRVPMEATSSIYLLQGAKMPAVLVECGFLSNPEECAQLKTPTYQKAIAEAIADGIVQFDAKRKAGEVVQGETTELKR